MFKVAIDDTSEIHLYSLNNIWSKQIVQERKLFNVLQIGSKLRSSFSNLTINNRWTRSSEGAVGMVSSGAKVALNICTG